MEKILQTLAARLPAPARRVASADRVAALAQFLRFGTVGCLGFVIDTTVVYSLAPTLGLYCAGFVSYLVAASATWALNRRWTFRGAGSGPAHIQWARFMIANLAGFVLNRGTYVVLIATVPLCAARPVLPVAAGAIAGMFCNFRLSKTLVFR